MDPADPDPNEPREPRDFFVYIFFYFFLHLRTLLMDPADPDPNEHTNSGGLPKIFWYKVFVVFFTPADSPNGPRSEGTRDIFYPCGPRAERTPQNQGAPEIFLYPTRPWK